MFSILKSDLVNPFEPMAEPLQQELERTIDRALAELKFDNIFCNSDQWIIATITVDEDGIFCGAPWVDSVLRNVHLTGKIEWHVIEGAIVLAGEKVCTIHGKVKEIFGKEKIILDFLSLFSAISTRVNTHTLLVSDTAASLYYNYLYIPEFLLSYQYAIRVGGGYTYNISCDDECLISKHHIQLAGNISVGIQQALYHYSIDLIKVEVSSLKELVQVIELGVTQVKLCGFTIEEIAKASTLVKESVTLEVYVGAYVEIIKQITQLGITKIIIDDFGINIPIVRYSLSYTVA